jgi:replicative DNA helicase
MTDELLHVPYSPAAEAALIGSLIVNPESIKELQLSSSEFYLDTNRWIFEAIHAVRAQGKDADFITICKHLEVKGILAEVGGSSAIMGMVNYCVSSLHIKSYAKIIRELARRRVVIQDASNLATAAYNQDTDLDAAIAQAMDSLSKTTGQHSGAAHISEGVSEVYDQTRKASDNPQEVYGIPTGFDDWDRTTFGLQPGTVIKISGEPGVGKSLLAMQVLANAAKAGHPGVLYELEMRRANVIRRQLSGMSRIPTHSMLQGKMQDDDWSGFTTAVEELSKLPIYIEANSQLTTADIRADLHRLKKQAGVELVVIDYESLLNDFQPGANDLALSSLRSARVHGIATDLNLAVISLSDMNKEGIAGNKPGMTGVGGTAKSLHDADEIMMMRRDKENENLVTMTWEKNREGKYKRYFQLLQQQGYPAFVALARPSAQTPARVK